MDVPASVPTVASGETALVATPEKPSTPRAPNLKRTQLASSEPPSSSSRPACGYFPLKAENGQRACQACGGPTKVPTLCNGYRRCHAAACNSYLANLPTFVKSQNSYYFRKKRELESIRKAEETSGSATRNSMPNVTSSGGSTSSKDGVQAEQCAHKRESSPPSSAKRPKQEPDAACDVKMEVDVKLESDGTADIKVEPVELKTAKVEPVEFKTAKMEPLDLKTAKVEPLDLKTAKVEPLDLKTVKVEPLDLKTEGFSQTKLEQLIERSRQTLAPRGTTINGLSQKDVKELRPPCGFFPFTRTADGNPLCQSCLTRGRYLKNGYRSCNKRWCEEHLLSVVPGPIIKNGRAHPDDPPRKRRVGKAKSESESVSDSSSEEETAPLAYEPPPDAPEEIACEPAAETSEAIDSAKRYVTLSLLRKRVCQQLPKLSLSDVQKRVAYVLAKTKKGESIFNKPPFTGLILTNDECSKLCEAMSDIARAAMEADAAEKTEVEIQSARELVEDQQREDQRKSRHERLPSVLSKRLRVVLRRNFRPCEKTVFEMSGYFHPKAEMDSECVNQHDFKLVRRETYDKERWVLVYTDKDVVNAPLKDEDLILSRVSPLSMNSPLRQKCDKALLEDSVDINDDEHVTIEDVVTVCEKVSNSWTEDCILVFRTIPRPSDQMNSKVVFLVGENGVPQDSSSFEKLSDAAKEIPHNKVITRQSEVESLKKYEILWYQAIPLFCDRCGKPTAPKHGQMQPSDDSTWKDRSRYALDTFMCNRCMMMGKAASASDAMGWIAWDSEPTVMEASTPTAVANGEPWSGSQTWNDSAYASDANHSSSQGAYSTKNKKCECCSSDLQDWEREVGYAHHETYVCSNTSCLEKHTWSGTLKPRAKRDLDYTFISCSQVVKLAYWIRKTDVFLSAFEWDKCDKSVDDGAKVTFSVKFGKDKYEHYSITAHDVKPESWKY